MITKLKIKLLDEQNGTYQGFVSENNKKDIFGAFLWDSGDFYIGEWKDNKINGQGIIYFSSGGYLEGFFVDSVACNQALLVFPNNDKYFANWKKGNLDGKVQMYFKMSKKLFITIYDEGKFCKIDSIKGNIKDVKKKTNIIFYKTIAMNEFSDKCDIGKLISKYSFSSTSKIINIEENKKLISFESELTFSKINFQDGGFFLGITQNNIPHGLGLFYYSDQKFDCGIYENGFLNGMGRKNFPNGDLYDGYFMQGKFDGEGIIYHKKQNEYNFGTFKENLIIDQKQRGDGFPQDISNQIKKQHHMNGQNYTNNFIPSEWINLSLQHNIQFIGTSGKQDNKQNSFQLQQQLIISAYSTQRTKDNSQKYHQKNLDTVYYLNQKIRAGQTSTSNQPTSKEITQSKEGTHRKNQTSLDFLKTGIDSESNSLQRIKNENIPILHLNQNSFIQQQQILINDSYNVKNELSEKTGDQRQRQSRSNARKQSIYLSPSTRNTTYYNSLLSPKSVITKNKKVTSSPSDRSTNQSGNLSAHNQINKNLQLNLQKQHSPPPSQKSLQSPLAKAQKSISQKLASTKNKVQNQPNNPKNVQGVNTQLIVRNNQPKINILNFKGNSMQSKVENMLPQVENQQSQRNKNQLQDNCKQQNRSNDQQKEIFISSKRVDTITQETLENNQSKENSVYLHENEVQTPVNKIKSEEIRNSNQNQNNLQKQNLYGKKQGTSLIGQKSQSSLQRVSSLDSNINYHNKKNNINQTQQRTLTSKPVEESVLRGFKTPINQVVDSSIDQISYKEASADISRIKQDSQGDLLNENKNKVTLSTSNSKLPNKSKIQQQVSKLKKQKSQEGQKFNQGYNSQLNNTPQRESNQNNNSINNINSRKNLPFQTEESMKHYYQTRIRKQIPEEISVREEISKNKQSAVLSTKSCSTNGANGSCIVSSQIQQKFINTNSEMNKFQKKKEVQRLQIQQKNNKQNKLNTKYKNQISNGRSLKFSKGLLSVKSQDNLTNEISCSFSSLQDKQNTQNDDNQKSLQSKFDQYESQTGLECVTQGDQDQNDEIELMMDQNLYEEDFIINNENKNSLNKPLRGSECSALNGIVKSDNIYPELIILKKGFSGEEVQNNTIDNLEQQNQGEEKSHKNTISDQIKHILQMQKNNNSKHKFSVKPFMIQMNEQKQNNHENYSRENQQQIIKGQTSKVNNNQNKLKNHNPNLISQPNSNYQNESCESQKVEQSNQIKTISFEVPSLKTPGERHILTPFNPSKNQSNLQKNSQSSHSYQQIKNQKGESIRSINQKMSSYSGFQERLNAIGQCIYKKDWNSTQSQTSIKSLSRNNSTLGEKNQLSEDNINTINPQPIDYLPNKEEKKQQQKSNVSQLVINYLQAQNSVSNDCNNQENKKTSSTLLRNNQESNYDQIENEHIVSYNLEEQNDKKEQLVEESSQQSNTLYQSYDDSKQSQVDKNNDQKLQDSHTQNINQTNFNNECNLKTVIPTFDLQNPQYMQEEVSQTLNNINKELPIHNIKESINNIEQQFSIKENSLNDKDISCEEQDQPFVNILQNEILIPKFQNNNNQIISELIQRSDDQNLKIFEKNHQQIEQVIKQNEISNSNQNVPFFSGILKTEEGEADSVNKNDLACLQLNELNESGIFDDNQKSEELNELQIDQKHFNEDFLGLNDLDELFSQNSGSLCSQSPSKQDINNKKIFGADKLYLNQFDIKDNKKQMNQNDEEDDDLEFQKIFDCQINLENLDIFDISSQPLDDNFNKNDLRLNKYRNNNFNLNNNHIYRPNIIEDIGELSPIKLKENTLDDPIQQQQMIIELHFYEDILLQQTTPKQIGGYKCPNQEDNGKQYQKYRPVLDIINENASEDHYTSPKKKQKSSQNQIFPNREDFEDIVSELKF